MIITGLEMWLYFVVLPNIPYFISTIMHIMGVVCLLIIIKYAACAFHYFEDYVSNREKYSFSERMKGTTKQIIYCFLTFIFCSILRVGTPSEEQIAAIILVPAIVNNEEIQNLGNTSLELLNKQLENWVINLSEPEEKTVSANE